MWINSEFAILLIVVLVSTEVRSFQPRGYFMSRLRPQTRREKAAPPPKIANPSEDYSGSKSTSAEEAPPGEGSSSSEEALPAEKGELGIPEQLMKVRHGVYKGQVAVFVDSQSREEAHEITTGSSSSRHPPKPHLTTTRTAVVTKAHLRPQLPQTKKPSTTTTRATTTTTTTTTHKPKIVPLPTKISTTTTTTRRPIPPTPPRTFTPVTKKQPVSREPATLKPMFTSPGKQTASTCLHLGGHCRRHNECCTHHCNWRMGMKCDYTVW